MTPCRKRRTQASGDGDAMINRRELLQVGAAAAAIAAANGLGSLGRAAARERLTEQELLRFDSVGNITLLHFADLHAQLVPVYFREPSVNIGVGEARGLPPHLVGAALLEASARPRSADAYALACRRFRGAGAKLRPHRRARPHRDLIKAVRAERGDDRVLLLDGGDTWQG